MFGREKSMKIKLFFKKIFYIYIDLHEQTSNMSEAALGSGLSFKQKQKVYSFTSYTLPVFLDTHYSFQFSFLLFLTIDILYI